MDRLKKVGFEDVQVFEASDFRKKSVSEMWEEDLITTAAALDLVDGRRRHEGMSSAGGVGVCHSFLRLLRLQVEEEWPALLIAEEDLDPTPLLHQYVREAAREMGDSLHFDVLVFSPLRVSDLGCIRDRESYTTPSPSLPSWAEYLGCRRFWGLHAALYSLWGARRILELLTFPISLQIDAEYSVLSQTSDLCVLLEKPSFRSFGTAGVVARHVASTVGIQVGKKQSCRQKTHFSSIQDGCPLCDLDARFDWRIALSAAVVVLLLVLAWRRSHSDR